MNQPKTEESFDSAIEWDPRISLNFVHWENECELFNEEEGKKDYPVAHPLLEFFWVISLGNTLVSWVQEFNYDS